MKNYKRIRRIFENTEISTDQPMSTTAPQPAPPAPSVPAMPTIDTEPTLALPPAAASVDPMTMTVRDFLEKVKSIEPLVAMGIEAFVEKNMGSFTEPMASAAPTQEPDLSFSSQVPEVPAENDLTFSSQVPAEESPAEMPA